jgi:putative ABC transport system permease protein
VPIARAFADRMGTLFPIFFVSEETMLFQASRRSAVGLVAAAFPMWRTASVRIVDGFAP